MPTVVINTSEEPILEVPMGGTTAGDDLMAKRRAAFAKFEATETPTIDLDKISQLKAEPPPEQLDSVVVKTPIGIIEFGPPTGISTTLRIALMMGEDNPNRMQTAMLRTLMSIRTIDGSKISPINSMVEAQALANIVGDGVLDYLYGMLTEYFPAPRKADLQVLQKNKRIS